MTPMSDPYTSLGHQLVAAAERREATPRVRRITGWRLRRMPAIAIAVVLVLVGGAVAVAATGLLEGSPVKPEGIVSAVRGKGVPLAGQTSGLLLRTPDPAGGLPWAIRLVHTTRGQICVEVGRVEGSRLGELGTDSAFGDDGRFHPLAPDALTTLGQVECVPPRVTLIAEEPSADDNAVRVLPEDQLAERSGRPRVLPPTSHLRTLAYGLLGPHAVSVTFRSPTGFQTMPVTGREGAFLIIEPAGYLKIASHVGDSILGEATQRSVRVTGPSIMRASSIVTAATFRFGTTTCSQGTGAPVQAKCPTLRPRVRGAQVGPTRNLRRTIELTLLRQSAAACRAAYLLEPCYKAQLEFRASYTVSSTSTEYDIQSFGTNCQTGGRPESAWGLERDVKAHETVHTTSVGLFTLTPKCLAHEGFEVRYGKTSGAPEPLHAAVILGTIKLSEATIPSNG